MRDNIHKLPNTPEIRFNLATASVSTDPDLALREANKLIEEGFWHAYTLAGVIYEKKGDYENARISYQRGIEKIGALESWLGWARLCLLGRGAEADYAEALKCYWVVCEDADHFLGWLMLGIMHRHGFGVNRSLPLARDYFNASAAKGSVVAYREIAEIDFEEGRFVAGAVNWLRCLAKTIKLVALDPADIRLRNDLAIKGNGGN